MMSASSRPALVPEEEYVADDWLEDDTGRVQSKKRRRITSFQETRREDVIPAKSTRGQPASITIPTPTRRGSASQGLSMKGRSRQVMVILGSHRSSSPLPFTQEEEQSSRGVGEPSFLTQAPVQHQLQAVAPAVPAPIRVWVRVQDNVFLIPIPHSAWRSWISA